MDGKSRNEIFSLIGSQSNHIPRHSVETFLKANFRRIRTKQKKVVYTLKDSQQAKSVEGQVIPDDEETGDEHFSNTMTYSQPKPHHSMQRRSQKVSTIT